MNRYLKRRGLFSYKIYTPESSFNLPQNLVCLIVNNICRIVGTKMEFNKNSDIMRMKKIPSNVNYCGCA